MCKKFILMLFVSAKNAKIGANNKVKNLEANDQLF